MILLAIIGSLIICFNINYGIHKDLEAWPFCCHPTFDTLAALTRQQLTVQAFDANGENIALGQPRLRFGVRWVGVCGSAFKKKTTAEKSKYLAALWDFWDREDNSAQKARTVRFYNETLTTIPEHRSENPIARQLNGELAIHQR
jgi:hypothetical protein